MREPFFRLQSAGVLFAAGLFIVLAIRFIPLAGFQQDELLFATPFGSPGSSEHALSIFRHKLPLMVMSYVGCLKTWLYAVVFGTAGVSPWSVRFPMVLAGAISVVVFGFVLSAAARGLRHRSAIAIGGALLLATDPTFVLTDTFDWGPVALQHLCLLAAILGFVRWHATGSVRSLGTGCFVLGLALWDKAIFLWTLAGLVFGVALMFRGEVRRALPWWRTGVLCFLLGALPLVLYNVRRPLATFRGNASLSAEGFQGKAMQVVYNLRGEGLNGYVACEDWVEPAKLVTGWLARVADRWQGIAGEPRSAYLDWALLSAALLLPFWWRTPARRQLLFVLTAAVVTWLWMAFTKNAGGGAHHAVLLWPWPHWFVAVAWGASLDRARRGWMVLAVFVTLLCARNVLVLGEFERKLERNGPAGVWTDALWNLDRELKGAKGPVFLLDWGMENGLELLDRQRDLRWAADFFADDEFSEGEQKGIAAMFATEGAVFVGHVKEQEVMPGVGERFAKYVERSGCAKRVVASVPDFHGRAVFEVVRVECGVR